MQIHRTPDVLVGKTIERISSTQNGFRIITSSGEMFDLEPDGSSLVLLDTRDKTYAASFEDLLEAIRLTQEYAQLPALDGWSWYDAYKKYRPVDAERMRQEYVRREESQGGEPSGLTPGGYCR